MVAGIENVYLGQKFFLYIWKNIELFYKNKYLFLCAYKKHNTDHWV